MVLKQLERLGLEIELRNIHQKQAYKKELINGGGRKTVPCLRIQLDMLNTAPEWMYESLDIIEYLKKHYDAGQN
ncbi:hypothetical protein MACH26_18730 [Planctobacterium marinum]|uniref:GST N-terminal domain-containing protein n=2 Tax=Planctobacterium marinum TaxID=1631968 RepID=A0AA48HMQ3_9ALTE|nr:hypothetical protein MACH26_18730 [Planctobacterium marinum]